MNAEQWQRAKHLFHSLLDQSQAQRSQTLSDEGDTQVALEVKRLLDAHLNASEFMQAPAESLLPQDDPIIGRQLGPFLIERLLGEGGSGRVYLGQREGVGGAVAVKLLRGRFAGPEVSQRFYAEQSTLARLDHPNIARLLQVGIAGDGTPWLAMEYVDGVPFCEAAAAMPLRQRLQMIRSLLGAVDYAHRQLVVHRDIKPGNLLVDRRGEPRLLDFGIAKRLDDSGPELTQGDQRPRTPAYAAPEQVRGDPVSVATDVYAIGVLLYETLTGERPWRDSGTRLDQAILAGEPALPSSRVSGAERRALRGDLDAIVLQAMHREPDRRYPSAAALADDLQRYLDQRPVLARKQTTRYRGARFLRRNLRWVAVASLVGVLLTAAFVRETRLREAAALEAQKSGEVAAFLLDIFDAGDAASLDFAISRESTVMDLMARADARLDELSSVPLVKADLAHKIGKVYWGLSEYAAAERLFATAIELRERTLGDSDDTAESYLMQGRLYGRTGRYADMLDASEKAYGMRLALLGPDDPATLRSLARIGDAHYFLNDLETAEGYFLQAVAAWRKQTPAQPNELGDALSMAAAVKADRGQLLDAIPMFEEVLALRRAAFPEGHPALSIAQHNLSTGLFDVGRVNEAIVLLQQSIAIDDEVYDSDHLDRVINYEWMARYQVAAGDIESAAAYSEQAVWMATRLHAQAPNQGLLDRARQMQVEVLREQRELTQALALQRDVLASRLANLPAGHTFVIGSRSVLADLLRRLGDDDAATEELALALAGWQSQPLGYTRQLVNSMDAFANAGRCDWLTTHWPNTLSPIMHEAVERGEKRCATVREG